MNQDISVIVPYYNESETIITTLDLLSRQTFRPKEVILVDSGSRDGTYEIIQDWIGNRGQGPDDIQFTNLRANTGVPSSSKNEGIRVSKSDLVAFMDCGLTFGTDWLERQVDFLISQNFDVVSGGCYLTGVGLWDCSAVAQTYGYKRFRPTVPSSLVKKSVFEKTGLFLKGRRSGYDVDWVNRLRILGITRAINQDVVVQYDGINYAESIKSLFLKSARYAEGALGLQEYYYPYAYIILFFLFWPALLLKPSLAVALCVSYFVVRGYLIPILKSRGVTILMDKPLSVLALPVTGFVIDSGKVLGLIKGIFEMRQLRKKTMEKDPEIRS
jgi:glycosyltransferase involved in cell wall biosynthesis